MASKLPYMLSVGLIPKILEKVQNARRPERFTQDFLGTKLGHASGSAKPVIPLLKRMGFLGSDGAPTELYDQFRNPETQGAAVATGMRRAFGELYDRNEYVHDLSREKLTGLVVEVTGSAKDERSTKAIVGTFSALNDLADFEADGPEMTTTSIQDDGSEPLVPIQPQAASSSPPSVDSVDLRVGYTINLNLPETSDPAVFDAIFSSLNKHLLKR